MSAALYLLLRRHHDQETPVPTVPTAWTPGALTVHRTAYGYYRLQTADGYKVSTLYGSSDPLVEAAANAAADYPRVRDELAAERARADRLADAAAKALETFTKTNPAFRTAEMKQMAAVLRDALRGPASLADVTDAEIAAALGRIEAAADDAEERQLGQCFADLHNRGLTAHATGGGR